MVDIAKHLSKEKVLEFIGDNELLRDLYNCGPVYQASIDDFVINIIERSIDVMKEELLDLDAVHENLAFIRGNDTGVMDCIFAFRNQFLEFDE